MELDWAREAKRKGEEDYGGSAEAERGSGDDCDDEDGCEASGEAFLFFCTFILLISSVFSH